MNKKGFTLTEFVVIIAVIGILFSIAMPSTIQVFRRIVDQRVNEFVADLKDLREIAISRSANISIEKSGDNSVSVTIVYPDSSVENRSYTYSKIIFGPASFVNMSVPDIEGEVPSDGFTFPDNKINFLRYGSPTHSGAIYIRDERDKKAYAISITLSGRIKLWKWVGGWK